MLSCRLLLRFGSGALIFCFGALSVSAVALRIPNQDPEAIARANAFTATANNPSAIYYNPAGITHLDGLQVQAGLHTISVNSRYESFEGSVARTKFELLGVPSLYSTLSLTNRPISFGLGLYAPFGLGLQWPDDSGFRNESIEGRLLYVTLNPIVAWQVLPSLSIGVGPTVNYARLKFRQGIVYPTDQFTFDGDDYAYGYNLGLLWQPHPQWSVGAKYHSATRLDTRGVTELKPYSSPAGTRARLDFPEFVMAGISFRPNTNWNIEFNIDWTDWNVVNTVIFNPADSADIPFPLNWRSSFFYQIGATRYWPNGWFLGAGYFFSENSTTTRDFAPTVPDTDLHVGSIGVGRKGRKWNAAIAAQIMTGPDRVVRGSESVVADGRYRFFNVAVTWSVTRKF